MYAKKRNLVVARFKDGKMIKGRTFDFSPVKTLFHLLLGEEHEGEIQEIVVEDLKALFFVKSLQGNKDYKEKKMFDEVNGYSMPGLKIKVKFKDGEVIRGITNAYRPGRKGFFISPVDPQSNNDRIYIVSSSVSRVSTGSEAES